MIPIVLSLCLAFLFIALLLSLFRFYKGPDVSHRLMALEVISLITLSMILLGCMAFQRIQFFDVVMIGTLVPFLGSFVILRLSNKKSSSSKLSSEEKFD